MNAIAEALIASKKAIVKDGIPVINPKILSLKEKCQVLGRDMREFKKLAWMLDEIGIDNICVAETKYLDGIGYNRWKLDIDGISYLHKASFFKYIKGKRLHFKYSMDEKDEYGVTKLEFKYVKFDEEPYDSKKVGNYEFDVWQYGKESAETMQDCMTSKEYWEHAR